MSTDNDAGCRDGYSRGCQTLNYRPILSVDVEDWLQSTWDREAPIGEVARTNTLALLDRLVPHPHLKD